VLAVLAALLLPAGAAHAAVLLDDSFDDGDVATNTNGTGSGFTPGSLGAAPGVSETGGGVTVSGSAVVRWLESNDGFDPTGTTLTAEIADRDGTGFNGVSIGWAQAGTDVCCETTIALEVSAGRTVLDLQAKTNSDGFQANGRYVNIADGNSVANAVYDGSAEPIVASVYVDASGWAIDVIGPGVDVHQSGDYTSCLNPDAGDCVSLADVMAFPGVDGSLRPFLAVFREDASATFSHITVESGHVHKCAGSLGIPGDHIVGTLGNDTLRGTPGNDVICGGDGKDLITGLRGDDTLTGEGGADRVRGRVGNDVVSGGAGRDDVTGGYGSDQLSGDAGADHLIGGRGPDSLLGGPGPDDLVAGGASSGDDLVDCGSDADTDTWTSDPGDAVTNCP
jgi:Ca2+-binding RTX toxin-like protein